MADYLDLERLRKSIAKELRKKDVENVTISISKKQASLLKSHLDSEIQKNEDFYICDR